MHIPLRAVILFVIKQWGLTIYTIPCADYFQSQTRNLVSYRVKVWCVGNVFSAQWITGKICKMLWIRKFLFCCTWLALLQELPHLLHRSLYQTFVVLVPCLVSKDQREYPRPPLLPSVSIWLPSSSIADCIPEANEMPDEWIAILLLFPEHLVWISDLLGCRSLGWAGHCPCPHGALCWEYNEPEHCRRRGECS